MQDYVGYRTQKRLASKKKKHKWWRWLIVLAVLIVVFIILGAVLEISPIDTAWQKTVDGFNWVGRKVKALWPFKSPNRIPASEFLPEGKETAYYLLAITKKYGDNLFTSTVVVAYYDSRNETGSLVYIPNDLSVNVPGVGMDQLSSLVELDEGRITKTLVTVENLLGIKVDRYVLGTDGDVRIVLDQIRDDWEVDVPARMSWKDMSLAVTVDLKPGKQKLSGKLLASYLTYSQPGKELDLIDRQRGFAPEFLAVSGGMFDDISKLVTKNASLLDTDASNKELTGMWQAFTLLKGKALKQGTIPVKEFKFENTTVHRVDTPELPAFEKKYLDVSPASTGKRYRVEILNGNGVPGIGEQVASRLDLDTFQIVNSANADSFEHPETVIIIYSQDAETVKAAEKLRNELEVGRIEAHPEAQDMADISVIIGKDYASK
ncbi:MAG: LCP family protein [Actinobacteria bacterium]|nr:LCP family protein [Actinomycetota bacterium]MBU1943872.1 LCP family protein [Actinomycetota bacterium]MBU2688606.1 LCP family protein [Actinomycetota bacterium]